MLIQSRRHTAADVARWAAHVEVDKVEASRHHWPDTERKALDVMAQFAMEPCYVGVSWGKDSVVVAHLAWRLFKERGIRLPLVWICVKPIDNPDCPAVRDAFLARWPLEYAEIETWCEPHAPVEHERKGIAHGYGWTAAGRLEDGFAEAARRFGARYISGIRAAESGQRTARMRHYGHSTERTCAPIGWWPTSHVYAYLQRYDLPIHPAYGCLGGGMYDRDRLRVSALGRTRGQGMGRWEWEHRYYRDEMRALERMAEERLR